MSRHWSHEECFASYGTRKKNPRQSWSARNEETKCVVATLWIDRFENVSDLYRFKTHMDDDEGSLDRPGHRELIDNLRWAADYCDGEIRVIVAVPADPKASPRRIKECYPRPNLRMRVTHLDEVTGEFELRRIPD